MNSAGKFAAVFLEQRERSPFAVQAHARLERRADQLLIARRFQALEHLIPHWHEPVPVGGPFPLRLRDARGQFLGLRETARCARCRRPDPDVPQTSSAVKASSGAINRTRA